MENNLLYLLIKSARPRQWIKNLAMYAALTFSGFFFTVQANGVPYFVTVTFAFIVFSFLTSAVYIFNDIVDKDVDGLHPFKKKRPIASGKVPVSVAWTTVGILIVTAFTLSLALSPFFRLTLLAYLALQILYAKVTKHIAILDIFSIATGFLLRVYAGAVVVDLHISIWFLLTIISASLFLAVGKRQSERTLLKGQEIGETRKTLKRYSQRLLDQYTGMFASATWLTYALFAFQRESVTPEGNFLRLFTILPRALQSQKLLMLTIPFVIFGVLRYLQLVYEKNEGESPEKVLLGDRPLLIAVFLFCIVTMIVLYVI